MKFYIVLLSIVVACQAVSFSELLLEEWESYKVSEFYPHFFVGSCDSLSFIDKSDVKKNQHASFYE
jgi:hypothetical protein